MSYDEFIKMIQEKQLEHSLKLSKTTEIKLGNKTFTKRPLTAKQWREIVQLNQKMVDAKTELARTDILIEMREKGALYYFGIPVPIFDENYEKVYPIVEGCIIRSNSGFSSDIDLNAMLEKFQQGQGQQQPLEVPHSNSMTFTPPPIPGHIGGSSSHKKGKATKK